MRIEWDPFDTEVMTLRDGLVEVGGQVLARNVLDARWLADGPILTVDRTGTLRWYRNGVEMNRRTRDLVDLIGASLAMGGNRMVAVFGMRYTGNIVVEEVGGGTVFMPELEGVSLLAPDACLSIALSGDGSRLALGYATASAGRGVAAFDVDRKILVDRMYQAQPIDRGARLPLAFDYAGKRLAQAVPETGVASPGVVRVGRGEDYPRNRIGGAHAVALEYRGNLAAYAYREPPPNARGRLQFDYLDTTVTGDPAVGVLDTQTLESELPDLAALAFSRDRRRLACLSSTGAIEIVPVP